MTEAEKQLDIFGDETFIKDSITNISGKIGATILRAWGFPKELIEVAEQWDVPAYQPAHPSYVDFIRIAAIKQKRYHAEGEMSQLLKPYVDLGLIPSTDFYRSPDFVAMFNDIKQLFA